ncbi:hypothetical protein [Gaoshiqia sp. Z1-71]|uniref:hypothetical protein n=1 Tax=Gaoshiqia hydrogeniformans TaxID=3290090 RepID=UPI003BF89DB8
MMGHKGKLKGVEIDVIFERHILCYLKNIPGIVKFGKRSINRRNRRQSKYDIRKETLMNEIKDAIQEVKEGKAKPINELFK